MSQKSRNVIQAFTSMAPEYELVINSELQHFWGWSYEGFVETLFANIPVMQGDIVLDVATGTGIIPTRLARDGLAASPVIGLDITLAMLQRARQRLNSADLENGVSLTCATAMQMPSD